MSRIAQCGNLFDSTRGKTFCKVPSQSQSSSMAVFVNSRHPLKKMKWLAISAKAKMAAQIP